MCSPHELNTHVIQRGAVPLVGAETHKRCYPLPVFLIFCCAKLEYGMIHFLDLSEFIVVLFSDLRKELDQTANDDAPDLLQECARLWGLP